MTTESTALFSLKVAVREHQDAGELSYVIDGDRRFQVMVSEIAAPVLRDLVNALCLEGMSVYLIMEMDEATPYIGLTIHEPLTTLWVYPSTTSNALTTSIRGGQYTVYNCDRHVSYRGLNQFVLERVLVEQVRLVLCPQTPLI